MYAVDRYGFNLLAKQHHGLEWVDIRLPFPETISLPDACLSALEEAALLLFQNSNK